MNELLVGKKTPAVADEIGVTYVVLYNLLRYRKIQHPLRDTSGDFVWSPSDINAAKRAIERTDS